MATYKEIRGNNIPIRSSDPSNPIIGEMWYNTTTGVLKGRKFNKSKQMELAEFLKKGR